jgi:hypothetical protein
MAAPETELRAALIAALEADAGVQATALGAAPRIVNRARPQTALPFVVVSAAKRPWDTTSDRGAEIDVELRLAGEAEGDKEGEAIFWAIAQVLRDWAPQTLTSHRLVNMELKFQDVRAEEDGKRYFGLQRWRAVTEET